MTTWTPERIKALREAFDESQFDFATRRLGVKPGTLAYWEQGQGEPNGSARMLLDRIEQEDLPKYRSQQRQPA